MATFGTWLKDQSARQDQVGEMSRYWAEQATASKIHSPSGIRRWLEQNGHLEPGSPVRDWLTATEDEYRHTRGLASVPYPPAAAQQPDDDWKREMLTRQQVIEAQLAALLLALGVDPYSADTEAAALGTPDPAEPYTAVALAELADDGPVDFGAAWQAADLGTTDETG